MNRRVCFVAPFGLGQKTTIWARTLPLARTLAKQGWSPTILIPPWDTPGDAGRYWADGGVSVINVKMVGGVLGVVFSLLHEIQKLTPTIVHIVKPRAYAGLVQWSLWQRRKFPGGSQTSLLLDADDWEQAWQPINRYPLPVAHFLAWQEEWGIRHADGVTTASQWLTRTIRQANPMAPVLHLPNGIEPPRTTDPRWLPNTDCEDVLFFTRFAEVSPQWLVDFFRWLHEKRPGSKLLIAGSPVHAGLNEPFRNALESIGGSAFAQVEWLGYVKPEQLAVIYRRIGCAIFPAEATVLQQAKCSVRLASTLLAGVPVVASAVGEQSAYGGSGAARLVAADAPPQLFAAVVNEVLSMPVQQQQILSEAARQHLLDRYGWEKLGTQLHDFYLQFLPSVQ